MKVRRQTLKGYVFILYFIDMILPICYKDQPVIWGQRCKFPNLKSHYKRNNMLSEYIWFYIKSGWYIRIVNKLLISDDH